MPDVAVYQIREHHRSRVVCEAMRAGIAATGDRVIQMFTDQWSGPIAETAVFYGLEPPLQRIFDEYRKPGRRAVYVDLGYWGRREGGRWSGYHKVVVNSRHPSAYFQARRHERSRIEHLGVQVRPWRRGGGYILLAGMGDKGALAEGYQPEQWERWAIEEIRKVTDRPIMYRPKPSWKRAKPIAGVGFSHRDEKIEAVLKRAHSVVTHHSNVAVDGLVAGIPAFCWSGVAAGLSLQELSQIERRHTPDGREQWIADIAWTQWSIAEMAQGLPWRHLKGEGLVP